MQDKIIDISEQKTSLEWDNYIDYLIETIDESKFMKRAEDKPMQTSKHELETHITSRATHVRAAANIAKRIAKNLGLNYKFIYAGMLMHDAGHPYTAHDGEEIFKGIGEEYNVEYYHHNAKGVEVVIAEDICEKAISKIPNIENRPELRKKLKEEFYYFLDIIISHDGEAGAKEMNSKPKEYPDIKTAVLEKLKLSNATNNYKFVAQTIEGRIAKYADVIAYLSTDIQDRFRLGIQTDFDDDYLEFIGEILSKDFIETREEKIQIAKNIIEKIKEDKLMQLVEDAKAIENREIIQTCNAIIKQIYDTVEDYDKLTPDKQDEIIEEIIKQHIKEYVEKYYGEKISEEQRKFLRSDIANIKKFIRNKLNIRNSVVEEITNRIKETLIQDLLKESKAKGDLSFSSDVKRLFFKAKELNYRYIPDTKWDYLKEELPIATYKLVHMVALALRKTGAIENKFYDKSIRRHIKNKNILESMKTLELIEDEEQNEYKKKYGITGIRKKRKKFTTDGGKRDRIMAMRELCDSVYYSVLDSGELFAIQYQNIYNAIENQIIAKVKNAAGRLPEEEAKKRKTHVEFLDKKLERQEKKIRNMLIKKYGSIENITEEQIMEFAQQLIKKERKKMEGKVAVQVTMNYLAGMSDKTILKHAEEIGVISSEALDNCSRGASEEERRIFTAKYNMTVEPETK